VAKRLRFFGGLALTLVSTCACEKLAGIEKKQLIVEADSGSNPAVCSVLSPGRVGLRVANMIPSDTRVDICVTSAGSQFPAQPLFASGGPGCPNGVGFGQYTATLNVGPGKYDVKLVPAGSDCSVPGLATSDVEVPELPSNLKIASTTIVAVGPDLASPDAKLTAMQDAKSTSTNIYLRFVNALVGGGTLNAGLVDNGTPPQITSLIFSNVPFGSISGPSTTTGGLTVDSLGYMIDPASTTNVGGLALGATNVNTPTQAFVESFISLTNSHHYTLFLTGISGQPGPYSPKLWSCDEGVNFGNFAECGEPVPVSMGVFHPNLTDIFTDYIDVRTAPAIGAIANSTANILCLPELYSSDIRKSLEHNVHNRGLYFSDSYAISPASDLTDQNSNTPVYQDPACAGDLQEHLLAIEQCLIDPNQTGECIGKTDADASDGKHYFGFAGSLAIKCAAKGCQSEFGEILAAGTHEADTCEMCAIAHLSSGESIEDAYAKCTSSNAGQPHFVYDGSTGLAVLTSPEVSLAPNETPEVIALPSSTWKRAAMRVPLKLSNGAIIDFWCASVRAPNAELFMPNGGPYYGYDENGQANPAGLGSADVCNTAEEKLQISRLITAVNDRATSSGRRAVVAALTYTSPQIGDENNPTITGLKPENFALFVNPPWAELTPSDYKPKCTYCGDNPLNDSTDVQWTEHLFGLNIGSDAATDTSITFSERSVPLTLYNGTDSIMAPVSQYYGIQSIVRVTK
jgi:hypothetical protein